MTHCFSNLLTITDNIHWEITRGLYDKKQQEYRAKQDEIKSKMDNLQNADEEYYIIANYILNLANRAYALFKNSDQT